MDNDKRKKICFVIDQIESPTAGTEKQILLLISNLDQSRFIPYLGVLQISPWLRDNLQSCTLYEIGVLSFNPLSTLLAVIKFSRFLRREGIDIVQTHFRDGTLIGLLSAKLAGVKVRIGSRRNQGFWMNRFELAIQKVLNRITTLFIANCENTKRWAEKTEGLDQQRIVVIYNGLEIEKFKKATIKQRKSFREQLGFDDDVILVGTVANLRLVKSVDVFIKAAKLLLMNFQKARFIVVGEGPERNNLENLSRDSGLESSIRFLGKRLDVPEILGCMDIGVLSSMSESFSNSILEYMAAELAVVCTDVGGAKEAIEDGLNGFIVDPGDYEKMARKLITIIENDLFLEMGRQGRLKAERLFSCEQCVAAYQRIYETIS